METADTRHGMVAFDRIGSGTPLVLIHGNTMTAASQSRLARRFADRHQVFSIDMLGHGRSARPADLFTTRYFTLQGEALADLLRLLFPTEQVVVFGMSAGALATLNAACVAPERMAALVLDGVVRFIDAAIVETNRTSLETMSPEWNKYMHGQHGNDWWPQLRRGILATMQQLAAAGTDILPCLEQISIPALVCQGAQDAFCPEDQGRAIAAALPQGRLLYDADAGHLLAWKDPDAFRTTVGAFLAEVV
ncbi:MAG TPA: alpha/beta fold hydrolase [Roseiflexaceae bacterium]|nr:alpha/beta fold hydrolase [Roseiflexaceae bacterium]HMP39019.1 alpha/beta fold hydrolase [Roseiflexaceae bacterium]